MSMDLLLRIFGYTPNPFIQMQPCRILFSFPFLIDISTCTENKQESTLREEPHQGSRWIRTLREEDH